MPALIPPATTVGTKTAIEIKSSDGLTDPAGQTLISAEIDSATPGDRGTALTFSTGRQGIVGVTEKLKIASSGTVSIASTTAGASGAGALVVAGGISAGNTGSAASYFGGAATFAGAVTAGDAITVSKSTNGDLANYIYNANAGAAAQTSLYISNGTAAAESTFITANGTGLTTAGGFIQDGGAIGSGTNLSGGLSIMARAASSDIRFYAGSHTNLVATFASTGAAAFAGAVAIGNTANVVSPTSPNRTITMVVGGVTLYIAAKTTND